MHRLRRTVVVWLTLTLVGACATPFAHREADLFREPPPVLPTDANAFWNDRETGTYGELTVGAVGYRRDNAVCRTARVTAIDDAAHRTDDRTLLYCALPGGTFPARSDRVVPVVR